MPWHNSTFGRSGTGATPGGIHVILRPMSAIGTDPHAVFNNDVVRTPHPAVTAWAGLPATLVAVAALSVYTLVRGAIRGHAALIGVTQRGPALLADYLLFVMLIGGFACIVWAASVEDEPPGAQARTWLGWAAITDVCAVIFLFVSFDGRLGLLAGLKTALLSAGIFAFLTMLARQARRLSPGAAIILPSLLAFALFTLPASAAPLLSAANRHGLPWLNRILVNSSPTLWLLHVVREATRATMPHRPAGLSGSYGIVAWLRRRFLYGITPLGQNMPVPRLLPWWSFVLITAFLAAAGSLLRKRRTHR